MKPSALLFCIAAVLFGQSNPALVDFDRQVHPILAAKCYSCHSQEKRSGGLSLATLRDTLDGGRSGATVRPGKSAASLLIQRITGEAKPRMPLGSAPLNDTEVATIRAWIDQGARATPASDPAVPKWEAPLALGRPVVPPLAWKQWDTPLDRFVAAYLGKHKAAEPQPVADGVFARRAYLDIWGLLPSPGELQAFLNDWNPGKRQKLVNRLLSDKRKYSENWISFWNDLLRNDEGVNYYSETASRKSITPWLLKALEKNTRYNKFVSHLLRPVSSSDPSGFLVGVNWRGAVNSSQTPAMQAAQNTAQVFLGINLKCNSCHDSFISRWKLKDAYALASYFSEDPRLQLYRCDVAQKDYAEPSFLYPELNRAPRSPAIADRRAAAAAIFLDHRNGRLPRTMVNRIWQRLMGRGLVENPDEMDGEPWSPELLDWLASDFVEHGYDLKRLIAQIVESRTYQMASVASHSEPVRDYVFHGPEVRHITAEQFADAIGAITGDWPVYQPPGGKPGIYTREWHVAANPLTRALGRPIRDQVYSGRDMQATTLQALELVNGETLTHWLLRGAGKMLGQLPPEPAAVFGQRYNVKNGPIPFDVDISRADKLWLLVQDMGSYSPEKLEAVWAGAELVGPGSSVPLSSLKPLDTSDVRGDGLRVKTPSKLVYDISGKGFTRLRGSAALENKEITSDLNPQVRFFIFEQEPNMDRLLPVESMLPLPGPPRLGTASEVVDRIFWHALGRAPSAAERRLAESALQPVTPPAAADVLWAVLMKPEFQLIH